MTKKTARVTISHNPSINEPQQGTMFVNCGKCLDERPKNRTPKQWARQQVAWTPTGFQIWCVRHNCNIDTVTLSVGETK